MLGTKAVCTVLPQYENLLPYIAAPRFSDSAIERLKRIRVIISTTVYGGGKSGLIVDLNSQARHNIMYRYLRRCER